MSWKVIEYAGLVLFAVIVPRMMGPDMYGHFAALLSFIALLTVVSGLGGLPTFGRFVPEYQAQGEKLKTQVLFTQVFFERGLITTLLSFVFLFLFPRFLPEFSSLTMMASIGAFVLGTLASTFYQFFYGLNALGKWLSQDALFKPLLLVGLLSLDGTQSLDRAALVLFLTQSGFFLLGLFWVRSYFTRTYACRQKIACYGHDYQEAVCRVSGEHAQELHLYLFG